MRTDLQPFEAATHAAKEQDIAKPYHTVILILTLYEREAIVSKCSRLWAGCAPREAEWEGMGGGWRADRNHNVHGHSSQSVCVMMTK